ncbi:hypothetical protein HGM15179_017661 [Zosterops borbonicus]|uniref:Uncharacterized protein n=1 Tax=Zosterops borbonicus TaxID=364589 RepID=A0A8K1LD49_9PASS|nr:hypothetical protein HGM15179_017661 [Zosterops borbonicus]
MIFCLSVSEAVALEFGQGHLEQKKAPISSNDLRRLYFCGKYYGFFPDGAKALERDAWGQFGAFLIRASTASCNAALVELVELWKQVYDVVANYKSWVVPVGACVVPGAAPAPPIPPVPAPRRRRIGVVFPPPCAFPAPGGEEGLLTRPTPLSEAGAGASPCGIAAEAPPEAAAVGSATDSTPGVVKETPKGERSVPPHTGGTAPPMGPRVARSEEDTNNRSRLCGALLRAREPVD